MPSCYASTFCVRGEPAGQEKNTTPQRQAGSALADTETPGQLAGDLPPHTARHEWRLLVKGANELCLPIITARAGKTGGILFSHNLSVQNFSDVKQDPQAYIIRENNWLPARDGFPWRKREKAQVLYFRCCNDPSASMLIVVTYTYTTFCKLLYSPLTQP